MESDEQRDTPSSPTPPSVAGRGAVAWWAGTQGLALAIALVASVGLALVVFAVPYVPTHDGPQHLYLAHLKNHYSDPGTIYAEIYRPTHAIVALGFSLVYAPIAAVLPWRFAYSLTLCIITLAWSWGCLGVARALHRERALAGLAGFAVAFQWSLYMGFFAYLLALAIGCAIAAFALSVKRWTPRHRLVITGLVLAQAVAHPFAAQVVGLLLGILVLTRHRPREWLRELGWLAVMCAPVVALTLHTAGLGAAAGYLPPVEQESLPLLTRLQLIRGLFVGGPPWRGWPVVALALLALGSGLARFRTASAEERAVAVTALLLLLAGFFGPLHLETWHFFSPRFVPPGVVLSLALLPVERLSRRVATAALLAVTLFTGASLVWTHGFNQSVYRRCGDVFSALEQPIRRRGFRLPVNLDSYCGPRVALTDDPYPFVEPVANMGPLFAIEQGGVVPYTFTLVPQLHPFVVRSEAMNRLPPVPPRDLYWWNYENPATRLSPEARLPITTQLARDGTYFEDVLLHGGDQDRRVFLERGYRADYVSRQMALLRFEGCPVVLTVRRHDPPPNAVSVEYTWLPLEDYRAVGEIPPAAFGGAEPPSLALPLAPCGALRLRVIADADGVPGVSSADLRCEGARDDASVDVSLRRELRQITCNLTPGRPRAAR